MNKKNKFLNLIRVIILLVSIILLSGCATTAKQNFQQGQQALADHHYQRAWDHFAYASQDGFPPAYYAIGYMYYYGFYVQQNPVKALVWFRRAAQQHQPQAVYAMNKILESGPTFGSLIKNP